MTNEQVSLYFQETRMKSKITLMGKEKKNESLVHTKMYTKGYLGSISRTYNYLNLLDLTNILDALTKEEDFFIDEDTILSVYEGHTIFSIFLHRMLVYE